MDTIEIRFLPQNKTARVAPDTNLLAAARGASVEIDSNCNGTGVCGKCLVRQVTGSREHPHPDERRLLGEEILNRGVRLACLCTVSDNSSFEIIGDYEERNRILEEGLMPGFDPHPAIHKVSCKFPVPSVDDNEDDVSGIRKCLGTRWSGKIPLSVLRRLPGILRDCRFEATLVFSGDDLIGIEPGNTEETSFGIAIDIGTTTVVVSLFDLLSCRELATSSSINPQKSHGLDVLSRIQHAREHPDGVAQLQTMVRDCINRLIEDLCRKADIEKSAIYEASVAANPTMMHLFLGVDPSGIGRAPYVPAFTEAMNVSAAELGLSMSDFGRVYCLPSVSAYIGADIVAGVLCTELVPKNEQALFIDIGTNGEIVFQSGRGTHACSCAAGPALEGMNISCGMRASSGAIDSVTIDGDVEIGTIDRLPAKGLCGSGVIDAVAELLKAGIVNASGRFVALNPGDPPFWKKRLLNDNGRRKFVLSDNPGDVFTVGITQKDVRQVQLAKGAILSGILALLKQLHIAFPEIERVYVAGAFGRCIRMENFARLGVFPRELLDRIVLVGNSSKAGAALCLLSKSKREEAALIARNIQYMELSSYPDYDRLFTQCLAFREEKGS